MRRKPLTKKAGRKKYNKNTQLAVKLIVAADNLKITLNSFF